MSRQEEIREFWLDGMDEAGISGPPSCVERWFGGSEKLDASIRERFGADIEQALSGALDGWANTPLGRLALILTLDQFTRNVFRGTARAFSGDAKALQTARDAVEAGTDALLRPVERYFLYLPFEHAEDAVEQERSVRLYTDLASEVTENDSSLFSDAADWALRHKVVIDRFGRFPSRNDALGRETTSEERKFLEGTPSGF